MKSTWPKTKTDQSKNKETEAATAAQAVHKKEIQDRIGYNPDTKK